MHTILLLHHSAEALKRNPEVNLCNSSQCRLAGNICTALFCDIQPLMLKIAVIHQRRIITHGSCQTSHCRPNTVTLRPCSVIAVASEMESFCWKSGYISASLMWYVHLTLLVDLLTRRLILMLHSCLSVFLFHKDSHSDWQWSSKSVIKK